jgi:hypothetical protein
MRAQSTVLSKYAEHTHQELIRTMSIWIGTDAYLEHKHQILMRRLSISVKITNLKRSLQNMLIIHIRN